MNIKPRKPTKAELQELFEVEKTNGLDYDPFYHQGDLEEEIWESIKHAWIGVFDADSDKNHPKGMLVLWHSEFDKCIAYQWENGQLSIAQLPSEYLAGYYQAERTD